jgi:hypothetical protein
VSSLRRCRQAWAAPEIAAIEDKAVIEKILAHLDSKVFCTQLAWTIHEITKIFRTPFSCNESCSVGNTVRIPLLLKIRYRKRVW